MFLCDMLVAYLNLRYKNLVLLCNGYWNVYSWHRIEPWPGREYGKSAKNMSREEKNRS